MSVNVVCIAGNITRDPEVRTSAASDSTILSFSVAVNDRVKNRSTGEWEDYANFVDCVMFGNRAQSLSGLLHKGMKVTVSGKLHYSSWERDGQRRSKIEVIANEVELPPRPRGQQDGSYGPQAQQQGNYTNQRNNGPQNGYQPATGGYQQQGGYQQEQFYDGNPF